MGSFDTIRVPCPKCQKTFEAQSKSGPCDLNVYELNEAPFEVLANINRHAPFTCLECGAVFKVHVVTMAMAVLVPKDTKLLDAEELFIMDGEGNKLKINKG